MMEFNVRNSHELSKAMKEAGYSDKTINVYTGMFDSESNGEEQTVTVMTDPKDY